LAEGLFSLAIVVPVLTVIVAMIVVLLPALRQLGTIFKGKGMRGVGDLAVATAGGPAPGAITIAPREGPGTKLWNWLTETQLWKSVFRHDRPDTDRTRVLSCCRICSCICTRCASGSRA